MNLENEMTNFSNLVETEVRPLGATTTPPVFKTYVAPVRTPTDHLPILDVADLPGNIFWNVLGTALTLKRDYESATEAAFAAWLCRLLPVTMIDAAGNIHVDTRFEPTHRSMFTAHIDTVHSTGGVNTVRVDADIWRADKGAALGADDGAGCAILAFMIDSGVPGYYVFFRGEERGGVGSSWLAENMPERFQGEFDRAVAFDRAGYYDIITHQSGGRCCSDEFAQALADKLGTDEDWFLPCNGGVYTDTAEFMGLIPECTNISVGYKNQHGDMESLDTRFCWRLAKGAVSIDWDSLPTRRDPKARESRHNTKLGYSWLDEWDDMDPVGGAGAVANGVYYGSRQDDAREAVEDAIFSDENSLEFMTLNAIEEYRLGGDKLWLLDLIAEAVYPEDPGTALRRISKPIALEDLETTEALIYDGWSADAALNDLYDMYADI